MCYEGVRLNAFNSLTIHINNSGLSRSVFFSLPNIQECFVKDIVQSEICDLTWSETTV